jgi:hypothetical protein
MQPSWRTAIAHPLVVVAASIVPQVGAPGPARGRCATGVWHPVTPDGRQERAVTDPDEWDQESGQLGSGDTLDYRGVADPLDEGVSPAERPWVGAGWGVTAREETGHEPLDGRLARELPDGRVDDGDGLGDASDTDGELWDDEVGEIRAGRLLARGDGAAPGAHVDLWAADIGIDGAGASAEEAAMHVVGDRSADD